MAFMVKNPGLLPGLRTIRSGAIKKRRADMKSIIYGCWRSCIETGDGTDLHQIKEDLWNDTVDHRRRPFVADAIIANPPSLAHVHCAQRLGIPLHMMFTWVYMLIQLLANVSNLISLECHGRLRSIFRIRLQSSTRLAASPQLQTLYLMQLST